mgnify:CR=1 FL=1
MKKEIERIKENYNRAYKVYRAKNPILQDVNKERKTIVCGLCGANVNTSEISDHIAAHETPPPANLVYQLTLPFRIVNGKLSRGAKFIKLLCLYSSDKGFLTTYNAVNLPDWHKLTDCDNVTVRYSRRKNRFIRALWMMIILMLTQINN